MKEERVNKKHNKSRLQDKKDERKKRNHSLSSSSSSDEWVEKEPDAQKTHRDDWMAMTGMLKTYTKKDIRPKREEKDKNHIDSYNPATSSRELNPHWKDGGTGLPQTAKSFRQSRKFIEPPDEDDYYKKSSNKSTSSREDTSKKLIKPSEDKDYYRSSSRNTSNYQKSDNITQFQRSTDNNDYSRNSYSDKNSRDGKSRQFIKPSEDEHYYKKLSRRDSERQDKKYNEDHHSRYNDRRSGNWRKGESSCEMRTADSSSDNSTDVVVHKQKVAIDQPSEQAVKNIKYLSDEKMNKLGAKIVKAEIMGDTKLVNELKEKLEAARDYRKQHPNAQPNEEDEGIMLIATNSSGSSRPLANTSKGDARSKGGKRKADTHMSGERAKYFGNDDKYNLAQMFQNEKYGNNYSDEAELARIASKSKNPNDDLEDIFLDEISKNHNEAKDSELDKNRAIKQHIKLEKSLEGCEYCLESKNMLKHLMVSCSNKVYVALPSRKSLVKGHCLISTVQHANCVTALDEDIWEEIMNYRKAITQLFNTQNMDVVFFETATRLHRYPHMVINCVPLPRDVGDMAAIYFKKALLECEAEWSMNKKVVDLKGKNIRKGVPKGLPYFWIDFGMDPGFAHVIEDQQLFPKTFAEEIIAGILDLDHTNWKNTKRELGDIQRKKVLDFMKEWKNFDPIKNKEQHI